MIICTNCGRENLDTEKLCVKCGNPLVDLLTKQSTHKLPDTDYEEGVPKWGSARFNGSMNLVLEVLETKQHFTFVADNIDEVRIGRQDPEAETVPSVDLTDSRALHLGVSRHHATIVRRDGALHIVDNSSANGTYLNGQRLVSQQPRILRDGDDIRLGKLILRISFRFGEPAT